MNEKTWAIAAGVFQTLAIVAAFAAGGLAWGALAYPRAAVARTSWLVDGFNVIQVGLLAGGDRTAWWGPARRAELLARAGRLDDPEAEIFVVFDGPRPAEDADQDQRARPVFAPSADAWVLERLRAAPDPGRVLVVTADRRLAERARRRGAQVVAPGEFLARCGSSG